MADREFTTSFKQLRVWQEAQSLAADLYELAKLFPAAERYGLISQIQRAASSVGANIAEGYGRLGLKEKVLFYNHARGSLLELDSHLDLSARVGFIEEDQLRDLSARIESVHKQLNALISSIRNHHLTTRP